MASAPTIPQRPAGRSQNDSLPVPSANVNIPRVPARPRRDVARSISPDRDSFARSPLNDPSFAHRPPPHGTSRLQKVTSRDGPLRPPSVDFPSIGGEGNEYAHFEHASSPEQPKNVPHDLPLHAPKASLPASQAQARIATVTRTDSNQAAAAGIGKPSNEDTSFGAGLSRTASAQRSRPPSLYSKDEPDHGIPKIGYHIPLFPGAGDVQAPTPTPSESGSRKNLAPSAASDAGATGRHHSRTKSGREVFQGPPGSYGMHGHGVKPRDALEKAWYSKHPDELKREGKGEYGPAISVDRKDYTMSSEDLNRLVHKSHTESMGASSRVISTPDEQIGYLASEAYSSRMATPKDGRRSSSQLHAESPLRKASFAGSEADPHALESDAEHDEPINIQPPSKRGSVISMGLNPALAEEHGNGGQAADEEGDDGYGAPILAADELHFRPEAQYMQAAVEPGYESDVPRRSRPSSRAGSVQLTRIPTREETGTPLEDVKEYEPLFPEDGDDEATRKAKFDALKHKRPDLARHHFPSSDVWEDTPNSLLYETTVDTPQETVPRRAGRSNLAAEHEPSEYFETPEAEQARKDNITAQDQQNFLPERTKKMARSHLNADVLADMPARPGLRHRFPSQDVWEDTPDSALHTTEITPEPEEEEQKAALPVPQGLARSQKAASSPLAGPVATADDVEPIASKPKPQVPARPAARDAGGESLTKSTSLEKEAPPVKAKPAVPARPVGGKIAALQAGFMNDLNNRLKLGPQAPPSRKEEVPAGGEEEGEEVEKAPLADARKGRAKGPSRRKPGVSPSGAAAGVVGGDTSKPPQVRFSMMNCWTVWEIDEDQLSVPKPVVPVTKATEASSTTTEQDSLKPVIRGPPAELDDQIDSEPADIQAIRAAGNLGDDDRATIDQSNDASVQTGQKDMSINHRGEQSDITAYVGGRAHPPGDVIVEHREGKEHVSATEPED